MYPKELVERIRKETSLLCDKELLTTKDVDMAFQDDFFILFFNSVCGCTARVVRPGLELTYDKFREFKIPVYSVFAGVELSACESAREKIKGYPPSSPSVFVIRKRKVIFALERHDLHSMTGDEMADKLVKFVEKNLG